MVPRLLKTFEGGLGPDRPAKYAPISDADFLRSRLEPTYALTKS